jgi:hypothetical protein
MKKLGLKILIFCLLVISVLVLMSFLPVARKMKSVYYYSHFQKIEHLRETKSDTAKRIVFIGGSGITFGIDSKMIADSLGTEVYNTSVHGGLGADYSITSFKEVLNPDKDILVIGYEFPFVANPHFHTEPRYYADFFVGKPLYKQLLFNPYPLNTIIMLAKVILQNFIYTFDSRDFAYHPVFRIDAFNEYGDIITHLDRKNKAPLQDSIKIEPPSQDYADLIKKELEGFEYYLISPPVRMLFWDKQKKALSDFDNYMYENFGDRYILSTIDFVYDENDFFEAPYHLNKDGRRMHTHKIIKALRSPLTKHLKDAK